MLTSVLLASAASLAAFALRWLTLGGAASSTAVGAAVWFAGGPPWATGLLWFVISSSTLGKFIGHPAPRRASQVLCNGGAAGATALLFWGTRDAAYAVAFVATLSAACADTWATEIGNRFGRRHFNIVSFAPSVPGPSGVCSIAGFAGALAGASTTAAFGLLLALGPHTTAICAAIGFVACVLDSVLGASLQREGARRGPLTNDTVNLIVTSAAAAGGYFLAS